MCGSMVDIQCPTAEIRRGNKKEERKKKPQDENIYVRILLCRAAINKRSTSYRDILFNTSGGEHTIEFRSHALLREQCKDHRVSQHHLWVLVNYLTIDTQQDSPGPGTDHRNIV